MKVNKVFRITDNLVDSDIELAEMNDFLDDVQGHIVDRFFFDQDLIFVVEYIDFQQLLVYNINMVKATLVLRKYLMSVFCDDTGLYI